MSVILAIANENRTIKLGWLAKFLQVSPQIFNPGYWLSYTTASFAYKLMNSGLPKFKAIIAPGSYSEILCPEVKGSLL